MTEQKAHADLGASNSSIWLNCLHAGRHMRNAPGKGKTSKFAAEGTVAHGISELILTFGLDTVRAEYLGKTVTVEGFDIEVTDDMFDHVMVYVDEVARLQAINDAELFIEERLSLNDLYSIHGITPHEPLFGTGDAVMVGPGGFSKRPFIRVVDLKYGAGVPVEADTSQGKYYGLGAMLKILNEKRNLGGTEGIAGIEVTIVQPRAPHEKGPIRKALYTAKELWDFGVEIMAAVNYIHDKSIKNLPMKAGKWCTFCPLAGGCKEQLRVNMALAKGEFSVVTDDITLTGDPMRVGNELNAPPEYISDAEIAFILNRKDEFKRWLDSVEQEAISRLEKNHDVPGWKLVAKRSRREWSADDETLQTYLGGYEDKVFPRQRVSPAQAEKVLPKDVYEALEILGYVEKVQGDGVTLAPAGDARPKVSKIDQAKRDFE
jgi:hypothetical protein